MKIKDKEQRLASFILNEFIDAINLSDPPAELKYAEPIDIVKFNINFLQAFFNLKNDPFNENHLCSEQQYKRRIKKYKETKQ